MKSKSWITIFCVASLLSLSGHAATEPYLALRIPDVEVVNQDGQQVKFNSDVIGNRIAVIDTIFTSCTTVCTVSGASFERLSKQLGVRVGRDVVLVSISIDPLNDTPVQLKSWGAKFHAGRGWTLVTGNKPDIELLLKSLGLFAPVREDHPSTLLIGSKAAGWTRASVLVPTDRILSAIDGISSATAQGKSTSEKTHPQRHSSAALLSTSGTDVSLQGR